MHYKIEILMYSWNLNVLYQYINLNANERIGFVKQAKIQSTILFLFSFLTNGSVRSEKENISGKTF